jgi:hypothetical protein
LTHLSKKNPLGVDAASAAGALLRCKMRMQLLLSNEISLVGFALWNRLLRQQALLMEGKRERESTHQVAVLVVF